MFKPNLTYPPASSSDASGSRGSPLVHCFFDDTTSTWTYVVVDPSTKYALVIDPVLEYDPASGTIGTQSAEGLVAFIVEEGLKVQRIVETHVHADHATGAQAIKAVSPFSTYLLSQPTIRRERRRERVNTVIAQDDG